MNYIKKALFIIVAAVVLYLVIEVAVFFYESELRITHVDEDTSPDGQYVAVFDEVGTPVWPFGPASVRVTVKTASGKKLEVIHTTVMDDGARMHPQDWDVDWGDDEVVITLSGSEQDDAVHTVPLS